MKKMDPSQKHTHVRKKNDIIDEASKESFPTSDPPAWTLGTDKEIARYLKSEKHDLTRKIALDHLFTRKIISVIEEFIRNLENNFVVNPQLLKNFSEFLTAFLDNIHSEKEEKLYPILRRASKHPSDYMMENLKKEHHHGRELLSKLNDLLKEAKLLDKKNHQALSVLLKEIRQFYRNHLAKEEEYILPFIKHAMTDDEEKVVMDQFNLIEKNHKRKEEELLKFTAELITE